MTVILEFVQTLLSYLKEGKASEIIGYIKKFFEDVLNKGSETL